MLAKIDDQNKNAIDGLSLIAQSVINGARVEADRIIEETREAVKEAIKPKVIEFKLGDFTKIFHTKTSCPSKALPRLITNAKLGLNSLLIGPAGSGKTMAAHQLAETLNVPFGHLCFTAGASETWLFGRQTPAGFVNGIFAHLYENGGVFLADEMDAADPNLLLSINTALSSSVFMNPISGKEISRHADFTFVGACNTHGKGGDHIYTGRNRLDAATLDRFVCLFIDYDRDIEALVCADQRLLDCLRSTRDELKESKLEEVISTRCIANSYLQIQAGISPKDVFDGVSRSWTEEARKILMKKAKGVKLI